MLDLDVFSLPIGALITLPTDTGRSVLCQVEYLTEHGYFLRRLDTGECVWRSCEALFAVGRREQPRG